MSASYFTVVHILVLATIWTVYLLLAVLAWRVQRRYFGLILLANFLILATISLLMMFVVDKYTKISKLENVSSSRILRNESIVFKATVRNLGNFTLSSCKFTVKLINNPLSSEGLNGSSVFKPSGLDFFGWFSSSTSKESRPNVIEHSAVIARDLPPKKSLDFSVFMPYPAYFKNTTYVTKLSCY
ncbi:DUF2393 family protein [Campylobacter sp. 19-13652]|uniref:DUF2393 family protein n=1 Tax=Campylobacter sp. 19-13652 TaxID=2840180 RepID=UPI001C75B034|nr:DUF2393 family protein [Campylobacter sp. 19-13652]BCX78579.1 hypothetical protein LBC_00410 [Campylobacter sp. 19-13652]